MKSKIILINWMLSFMALSIDTEYSPLWASIAAVAWFLISGVLFLRASRRGDYKKIEKRFKIDEL
ncbi:MAG: hypothetical protein VB068_10780 [Petrimonas sp.]|nr:hypothetical protein [Petrimonas sp.]MEA5061826.1 hypothetical protein [Petrimonas sp.]